MLTHWHNIFHCHFSTDIFWKSGDETTAKPAWNTSWWFQHIWNISVESDHFPRQGWKLFKNIWTHQLASLGVCIPNINGRQAVTEFATSWHQLGLPEFQLLGLWPVLFETPGRSMVSWYRGRGEVPTACLRDYLGIWYFENTCFITSQNRISNTQSYAYIHGCFLLPISANVFPQFLVDSTLQRYSLDTLNLRLSMWLLVERKLHHDFMVKSTWQAKESTISFFVGHLRTLGQAK